MSLSTRLGRIEQTVQLLMRHVGLPGRCECVQTRNADGATAFALVLHTSLVLSPADRDTLQRYVRRKLAQAGEANASDVTVWVRDGLDAQAAARTRVDASSARMASIAAAQTDGAVLTTPASRVAQARQDARERAAELRDARAEGADEQDGPIEVPLTDLGALGSR